MHRRVSVDRPNGVQEQAIPYLGFDNQKISAEDPSQRSWLVHEESSEWDEEGRTEPGEGKG